MSIRVKPQPYVGESRVALFINDRTNKVSNKLHQMRKQETFLSAQQAEGYTATLSHELKAPLSTLVFFVKLILDILLAKARQDSSLKKAIGHCHMVQG